MESHSKNFTAMELRCKCAACKQEKPNEIDQTALNALQRIRDRMKIPLPLTSAYRCRLHPEEARKAAPGRHNQGLAFDIKIPWGQQRMEIIEMALEEGFHGFGFAKTFIHLDYRQGELMSWGYA